MTVSVSLSPLNVLQAAVVARLRGDAELAALLAKVKNITTPTPAVVDAVPEGQAYPYVRVGDQLSTAANDLTSFGRQITMTLHVWTKAKSNGPGQAIATRVGALLDHQHAALSALMAGHRVVRIEQTFDQALDDPDPEIRHHVVRFTVETTQLN